MRISFLGAAGTVTGSRYLVTAGRGRVEQSVVVGPDAESEQWARAVADAVSCPHGVLEKTRRGDRDVSVSGIPERPALREHTPVLVDDIISSAQTMIEAVKQWNAPGRRAPVCVAVHGVFAPGAYEALREAGAVQVVTTNSVPHASNDFDIAPILAAPVSRLLAGRPVDVGGLAP